MSHYTVAVITTQKPTETKLERILAPYSEHISVAPYIKYTKQEVIKNRRDRLESIKNNEYKEYLENPEQYKENCKNPNHMEFLEKRFVEEYELNDEELYKKEISMYDESDIDKDGNIISTYNPLSKWDWYEVGGRWPNLLKLKNGKSANIAQIKDIDFKENLDVEKYIKENPDIKDEYEEMFKDDFYNPEYLKRRYPTLEDYVKDSVKFSTFAIIDENGEWHEEGEMGWFGMSSATPEDEKNWHRDYFDNFIKNLNDEYYMTIIDCHI